MREIFVSYLKYFDLKIGRQKFFKFQTVDDILINLDRYADQHNFLRIHENGIKKTSWLISLILFLNNKNRKKNYDDKPLVSWTVRKATLRLNFEPLMQMKFSRLRACASKYRQAWILWAKVWLCPLSSLFDSMLSQFWIVSKIYKILNLFQNRPKK